MLDHPEVPPAIQMQSLLPLGGTAASVARTGRVSVARPLAGDLSGNIRTATHTGKRPTVSTTPSTVSWSPDGTGLSTLTQAGHLERGQRESEHL